METTTPHIVWGSLEHPGTGAKNKSVGGKPGRPVIGSDESQNQGESSVLREKTNSDLLESFNIRPGEVVFLDPSSSGTGTEENSENSGSGSAREIRARKKLASAASLVRALPPGTWSLPNGEPIESVDKSTLTSWGSAGHDQGKCKPCAWQWKPSGCSNGRQCTFCHTCDADAIFRQRRERVSQLKLERRLTKASTEGAEMCKSNSTAKRSSKPETKGCEDILTRLSL